MKQSRILGEIAAPLRSLAMAQEWPSHPNQTVEKVLHRNLQSIQGGA